MNGKEIDSGAGNGRRFPPGGGSLLALAAAAFTLIWVIGSCRVRPEAGARTAVAAAHAERVVPDENVHYLETAAARIAAAALSAQDALASAPADTATARTALRETHDLAAAVSGFYLPVTAARDLLVGAWYDQTAGRTSERDVKLAEAGNRLREVVESGPSQTVGVAAGLLAALDSLELHKTTDTVIADDLRKLCRTFQERLTAAEFTLDEAPPSTVASATAEQA
jgi:hypothetical protein